MKVLLFDVWTKGLIHFPRLISEFKAQEIELSLVHSGSYGNEVRESTLEKIDGIQTYDITFFLSLDDCFLKLNPDIILFLSLDTLFTRAINRYAKFHSIPTVNLYHGLHSAFGSLRNLKTNYLVVLLDIFPRLLINAKFLFFYIRVLYATKPKIQDQLFLIEDIFLKLLGKDISVARLDGNPDFICVFNNYELIQAKKKYLAKNLSFFEVGIPDLLKFTGLSNSINTHHISSHVRKVCTYIGTGPRSTNMLLSDYEEYFQHITEINNFLTKLGYKVNFKLHHSRIDSINILNDASDKKITLINDATFVQSLNQSKFSIIEPSSASLAPAIIGMPVVLLKVMNLKNLKFGPLFNEYPRSYHIHTFEELELLVDELDKNVSNLPNIDNWLGKSLGPLPLKDLPSRIVNVLIRAGQKIKKN